MIPHHQEAVDTSKIILEKSTSRELKAIATKIVTAQEKEITQMKGWLKDWYPNSILKAEYMPMMQDLSKLSGHDLEDAFIADMIKHHEGAIAMAKEVLEISQRPEIVSIAKNIISTQKAEIAVFQKMMAHH